MTFLLVLYTAELIRAEKQHQSLLKIDLILIAPLRTPVRTQYKWTSFFMGVMVVNMLWAQISIPFHQNVRALCGL